MPLKESEAIVLRSYPLREADLLVTFFTRAEGKIRGVARAAKKSKKRFGGALEPLTHVILHWEEREHSDLGRLDACDVLDSPLSDPIDYGRAAGLAHLAEVIDELLPDREQSDAIFRLALTVLTQLRNDVIWLPLTYFDLWMARLTGLLPALSECVKCGASLNGKAYFHPLADGLLCPEHKRLASSELSSDSRAIAAAMLRAPVDQFARTLEPWPRQRAADLRKFIVQLMERHIEKNLVTATMLERL